MLLGKYSLRFVPLILLLSSERFAMPRRQFLFIVTNASTEREQFNGVNDVSMFVPIKLLIK